MAEFGQNADNTSVQTFSGDRIYASQGTPASSGIVTAGHGRFWLSGAGSPGSRLVIYSDNAGEPDVLLATSDELVVSNTTEAVKDYVFSGINQINIILSTPYWIGVAFDDPGIPSFTMSRANTANLTRFKGITYPTMPSPFASDGSSSGKLDIWIDYTPSASTSGMLAMF